MAVSAIGEVDESHDGVSAQKLSKHIGVRHLLHDGGGLSKWDKELLLEWNEAGCRARGRTSEAT